MGGALRVPVEFFARPGIRGLSSVSASIRKLNSTVNSIFYGAIFLGLQHSLMRVARGFIALNTEIENAQVGIAGLLTGITGAPIATTMKVARQEVAYFRREAAKLPGELPDYIQAFQLIAGPAFRAGATRDQARLLARNAVLAGSLTPTGRGMKTLPIDVLQALAGQAHQTNTRDLLTLLGMSSKEFNKLSQPDRLKTLLDGFGKLEEAAMVAGLTWDAQMATLNDGIKQVLRTLSGPLFTYATQSLTKINEKIEEMIPEWEFFLSHVGSDFLLYARKFGNDIANFDFVGFGKKALVGGATLVGLGAGMGTAGMIASLVGGLTGTLIGASMGTMMAGPAGTVAGGFAGSAVGSMVSLSAFTMLVGPLTAFFGAVYNIAANFVTQFPGHVVALMYTAGSALYQLGRSIYHAFNLIGDNPLTSSVMMALFDVAIGGLFLLGEGLKWFADTLRLVHLVLNTVLKDLETRWSTGRLVAGAMASAFVGPLGAALMATRFDNGRMSASEVDRRYLRMIFPSRYPLTPFSGFPSDDGDTSFQAFLDALKAALTGGDTNINGPVTIQITAERLDNPDLVARSFQEAMGYLQDFRKSGRSAFFPRSR